MALVMVFLVITQLFTYEKFADVLAGFGFGRVGGEILALLIPLLEIVGLPFLLSMKMSDRWRGWSRAAAVAAPLLWFLLAVWLNFTGVFDAEAGIFGATFSLQAGAWMILFTCTITLGEHPSSARATEA